MNKNIKPEVAIGIILILVFIVGGSIWLESERQQAQQSPTVFAPTNLPTQKPAVTQSVNTTEDLKVYRNDTYGFQITLPREWSNYKSLVNINNTGTSYVYIDLPTSDKTWPGDIDPKTGKSLLGYASMFAVTIEDLSHWTKKCLPSCDQEKFGPDCYACDNYVAKNGKYIFTITGPQAFPKDLDFAPLDSIKASFKITNN